MTTKKRKCLRPGCLFFIRQAEDMDAATGIEYLKLNSSQVNGVSDQHEKSKKPVLEM